MVVKKKTGTGKAGTDIPATSYQGKEVSQRTRECHKSTTAKVAAGIHAKSIDVKIDLVFMIWRER